MKNMSSKRVFNSLKKRQKGLTMIETIFVMLLVLGIILYAVSKYNEGQAASNLNQEQSNIIGVIGKIKSKYNTAPDFTGVTADILRNAEIFPDEMVSGTTVHSLLGGTITAAPANAVGTNDAVAMTIPGYSKKACNGITERIENSVYSMTVNGTVVKAANTPMNRTTVSTACVTGNNTVVFLIGKV